MRMRGAFCRWARCWQLGVASSIPWRAYATAPGPPSSIEDDELQTELERAVKGTKGAESATMEQKMAGAPSDVEVKLESMPRPPAKYELTTTTSVYRWATTAKHGRKIVGPLREWGDELKYRTGVHVEWDVADSAKLHNDGYPSPDDVDVQLYFFGADSAIKQSVPLLNAMLKQDPVYVRLAVFRRRGSLVEWLVLRRINKELRPPDIPPVSLKTPGKWTLLFENYREAAVRTLWEETGIHVEESKVVPTGMLNNSSPQYYWRIPVRYFVSEVPENVEVLGPQAATLSYMAGWDPRLLRQSLDPIDRVWSTHADPKTGCAWLTSKQIDELQLPLKGEKYMATRYTPPPESDLRSLLTF